MTFKIISIVLLGFIILTTQAMEMEVDKSSPIIQSFIDEVRESNETKNAIQESTHPKEGANTSQPYFKALMDHSYLCYRALSFIFYSQLKAPEETLSVIQNCYLDTQLRIAEILSRKNNRPKAIATLKSAISEIEHWEKNKGNYSNRELEKKVPNTLKELKNPNSDPFHQGRRRKKPRFSPVKEIKKKYRMAYPTQTPVRPFRNILPLPSINKHNIGFLLNGSI